MAKAAETADGSIGVAKDEEAGEKEGRDGVHGREVEKERILAGRRTGDWIGLEEKWAPVG